MREMKTPSEPAAASGQRKRLLLYGTSLILETVGAWLTRYPHLEIISLASPLAPQELDALAPDVIIFDVDGVRPEAALALLETRPWLSLIGIDPSTDQMLVWSGQHSRATTMQDLAQAIDALSRADHRPTRRLPNLGWLRQFIAAQTAQRTPTRKQKLAFAFAMTGLSVILVLTLALINLNANPSLQGTAIADGISFETVLTFIVGIALGGAVLWLWYHIRRTHRS